MRKAKHVICVTQNQMDIRHFVSCGVSWPTTGAPSVWGTGHIHIQSAERVTPYVAKNTSRCGFSKWSSMHLGCFHTCTYSRFLHSWSNHWEHVCFLTPYYIFKRLWRLRLCFTPCSHFLTVTNSCVIKTEIRTEQMCAHCICLVWN